MPPEKSNLNNEEQSDKTEMRFLKREQNHSHPFFSLPKGQNQEAPPILQKPANHSAGCYLMSFIISVYC